MAKQEHRLKTLPQYFRAVVGGDKKAELRKDDRDFQVGDRMVLCEYDGKALTGREVSAKITYVLPGGDYGLAEGFAVLSFEVLEERL